MVVVMSQNSKPQPQPDKGLGEPQEGGLHKAMVEKV